MSGQANRGANLRYRGWTLVDMPGGRYAAKGQRRVKVCRLHEDMTWAIREFRRVVDELEA